jgi:hypothetical protein
LYRCLQSAAIARFFHCCDPSATASCFSCAAAATPQECNSRSLQRDRFLPLPRNHSLNPSLYSLIYVLIPVSNH